jgi:hypothetical protein
VAGINNWEPSGPGAVGAVSCVAKRSSGSGVYTQGQRSSERERGVGEKGITVRDYSFHYVCRAASSANEHKGALGSSAP